MNDLPQRPKISLTTWLGLLVALFGIIIARSAVSAVYPTLTFTAALWKESLIWICVIVLLFVIRLGEQASWSSVGIGRSTITKSIAWGLVLAVICALLGLGIAAATHYNGGEAGQALARMPVWLVTAIVVRAGVVEELFYRGYAIDRLEALGLNRATAGSISLVIFGFAHWTGGWANIVIALALGAVLTAFYFWRRDLIANMIGHFLVDFIANVLPRLFS